MHPWNTHQCQHCNTQKTGGVTLFPSLLGKIRYTADADNLYMKTKTTTVKLCHNVQLSCQNTGTMGRDQEGFTCSHTLGGGERKENKNLFSAPPVTV